MEKSVRWNTFAVAGYWLGTKYAEVRQQQFLLQCTPPLPVNHLPQSPSSVSWGNFPKMPLNPLLCPRVTTH